MHPPFADLFELGCKQSYAFYIQGGEFRLVCSLCLFLIICYKDDLSLIICDIIPWLKKLVLESVFIHLFKKLDCI